MPDRSDAIARSTRPDVSVVVPVFEEEGSLQELVERLHSACDAGDLTFEAILIDDGSRDRSWKVIQDLSERFESVHGIRLQRNYGKSAALAAGFRHASGHFTVTMDADLQDAPEEVPLLIRQIVDEDLDLVSGWKRRRNDPLDKTVPSRFFNFVTRKISRIPLHDFNCGLKAYRTEVVKSVHVYGELHRYIPLLAKWQGYDRIGEKVVEHHPRKHGRTKFGFERFVRGFLDLISVVFLTRFAARPMHFFGAVGTLAFIGGLVISLYLTIDKLFYGHPLGDRPLLLFGVMLILLGAQMFSTGLLGEMLIRREMEEKPTFRIREETSRDVPRLSRYA
jgi:glycosyltransferase involved in cell wall biosynthesis